MTVLVYSVFAVVSLVCYFKIATRYNIHEPIQLLQATFDQSREKDTFWVIFHTLSFAACITNITIHLWKI